MAQPKVIEGTWDEIAVHAEELRAYPRLTLIVPPVEESRPSRYRPDLTPEERIRALDRIAERNRALPVLPPEAFERESLYAEDEAGANTMAIANTHRKMTEDEFMRLPDDGRKYELVDGEPKEAPTGVRQGEITATIIYRLMPYIIGRGVLCGSSAGFRMQDRNIRSPDVSFTRKERLPGGKAPFTFGDAAPDLCIEIISPSEEKADMARKIEEYFDTGAEQVWHLFPETEILTVFTSPSESVMYASDEEIEGGDLLPGFRCHVAELFALE